MAVENLLNAHLTNLTRDEGRPAGTETDMHCVRRWTGVAAQVAAQVLPPFGPGVGPKADWVDRLEIWMSDEADRESCTDYLAYDAENVCRVGYRARPATHLPPAWIDWVDPLNILAGEPVIAIALCAACSRIFPSSPYFPRTRCPACRRTPIPRNHASRGHVEGGR